MKVGDVIVAKSHEALARGSVVYSHAICVQVDPLVLVSQEGEMVWRRKQQFQVVALCQASAAASKKAFERFKADGNKRHKENSRV